MKENSGEHIDQLFRENLKGLQVIPPPEVWGSVAEQIPVKSSNTFRRIIAVAASLLIIFASTWLIVQKGPDSGVTSDQSIEKSKIESPVKQDNANSDQNLSSPNTKSSEEIRVRSEKSNSSKNQLENSTSSSSNELITEEDLPTSNSLEIISGKSYTLSGINTMNLATHDFNRYSIQPLTISMDVKIENPNVIVIDLADVKYGKNPRWGLGGNFSPLYSFRYTNPKSNQDLSYFYDKETGNYGFTGGMSAIYRAKGRFSIQTGIQFSRTGVSVNDLMFYQNVQTGRLLRTGIPKNNVPYQFETSIGQVTSGENPHYLADFELPNGDLYTGNLSALPEFDNYEAFSASITQNFEFFEIPLLVRYKIVDRKFGMNVMSGVGTSLLVDNSVFMYYQDQKIPLGQTEDISLINFAGTVGLGFEYSFNPKLSLNIEPTFKYFLNSINKNSEMSTHPYFFGIYSGLNIYF